MFYVSNCTAVLLDMYPYFAKLEYASMKKRLILRSLSVHISRLNFHFSGKNSELIYIMLINVIIINI